MPPPKICQLSASLSAPCPRQVVERRSRFRQAGRKAERRRVGTLDGARGQLLRLDLPRERHQVGPAAQGDAQQPLRPAVLVRDRLGRRLGDVVVGAALDAHRLIEQSLVGVESDLGVDQLDDGVRAIRARLGQIDFRARAGLDESLNLAQVQLLVAQVVVRHLDQGTRGGRREVGGAKVERHRHGELPLVLFLGLERRLGGVPPTGGLAEVVDELIGAQAEAEGVAGQGARRVGGARGGARVRDDRDARRTALPVGALIVRRTAQLWEQRRHRRLGPRGLCLGLRARRVQLGVMRARRAQRLVEREHAIVGRVGDAGRGQHGAHDQGESPFHSNLNASIGSSRDALSAG